MSYTDGCKKMIHNTVPTESLSYSIWRKCGKKKGYNSIQQALLAIETIKGKRIDTNPMKELETYKCSYCGLFHVGHSTKK